MSIPTNRRRDRSHPATRGALMNLALKAGVTPRMGMIMMYVQFDKPIGLQDGTDSF
jgi:hypothetical protein